MAPVTKKRRLNGRETPFNTRGRSNSGLSNNHLLEDAININSADSSSEDEHSVGRNGVSYTALIKTLGSKKPSIHSTSAKLSSTADPKPHTAQRTATKASRNGRKLEVPENETEITTEQHDAKRLKNGMEKDLEGLDDAIEEDEDARDPFAMRFAAVGEEELDARIKAQKSRQNLEVEKMTVPDLGRLTIESYDTNHTFSVNLKRQTYPKSLYLKRKLRQTALKSFPEFSSSESKLAQILFNYSDLLFGNRDPTNAGPLRNLSALHLVNHVMKTRDRVIKNNARLAKDSNIGDEEESNLRDQGFTRPKVLVLLETRQMCAQYVESIMNFYEPEQQENKKRFLDAFTVDEQKYEPASKPQDFLELFEGNDDNEFRIGLKLTRKNVKFYSPFYSSDIIFASPLGLRRAIDSGDPKKKRKDYDFLSSIEIIVVDQTEAMAMQNWSHVTYALSHLNLPPQSSHGCDFSRVRNSALKYQTQYLRQTIIFSAYLTPDINALYTTNMTNAFHKVKIQASYSGAILASTSTSLGTRIKQTFQRFHSPSSATDPDDRFKFFTASVLPSLARLVPSGDATESTSPGILVFAPTYFDYTRLRNLFSVHATDLSSATTSLAESFTVAHLTEYSTGPEASRAMSHFAAGRAHILLYTARVHHFRRYRRVRGVKRVIFYGLPDNPAFWGEMVEQVVRGTVEGKVGEGEGEVRCLFSRWDGLALERVVGTERVGGMVRETSDSGDVFEFR